MPRITLDISNDLKQRLMRYIAQNYDSYYGKIREVSIEALEEFLKKHGFGKEGETTP